LNPHASLIAQSSAFRQCLPASARHQALAPLGTVRRRLTAACTRRAKATIAPAWEPSALPPSDSFSQSRVCLGRPSPTPITSNADPISIAHAQESIVPAVTAANIAREAQRAQLSLLGSSPNRAHRATLAAFKHRWPALKTLTRTAIDRSRELDCKSLGFASLAPRASSPGPAKDPGPPNRTTWDSRPPQAPKSCATSAGNSQLIFEETTLRARGVSTRAAAAH
jgi:hypothetical protein